MSQQAPDGFPESRPAMHAMVTLLFTLFMVSVNIFMLNLMVRPSFVFREATLMPRS